MEEIKTGNPANYKISKWATWSLVLGISGFIICLGIPSISAVIFGIIALVNIGQSRGLLLGKGRAIVGIILGGLWILFFPVIVILVAIAIPSNAFIYNLIQQKSTPSEQDAVLELNKWFNNLAQVSDFRKLDGKSMEVNGVRQYEMEYRITIKFTTDVFEETLEAAQPDRGYKGEQHRSQGETRDLKGVLRFEQTENGWRYLAEPVREDAEFNPEEGEWHLFSDEGQAIYYRVMNTKELHENSAITSLRLLVNAEATWLQQDVDGNGRKDYWTYDVSCFNRMYRVDSQTEVAFVAIDLARADASPAALDQSTKIFGAAPQIENWSHVTTSPKNGYFFRAMLTDAQGNPYNQNEIGNTEFKETNNSQFAFVAYPAEYGKMVRKTFIVNQEGTVYGKDLGSDENKIILRWPSNNPAAQGWVFAD